MPVQRSHFRPVSAFALLIAVVSLSACGLLGINRSDCSQEVLLMLELDPPESATFTEEHCSMGIVNPTYTATLTIPAVDLVAFQQNTHIESWLTTAVSALSLKDQAEGMDSILFGSFSDGAISEEVLIDTRNPQAYTVYVVRTFID
ncbi:MAG: hypothetical protein LCI00_19055 [Chloroflexi bacterium]|nr:hypothetical protein [Chloroflexota bacterium]MCC6894179.1 hypothetical protein [Anaerolineae bacterium]